MAFNAIQTPFYLRVDNQINLFQLSIEKIIVVADDDLRHHQRRDRPLGRVRDGACGLRVAVLKDAGVPVEWAIVVALLVGLACGAFNGLWWPTWGCPS